MRAVAVLPLAWGAWELPLRSHRWPGSGAEVAAVPAAGLGAQASWQRDGGAESMPAAIGRIPAPAAAGYLGSGPPFPAGAPRSSRSECSETQEQRPAGGEAVAGVVGARVGCSRDAEPCPSSPSGPEKLGA